MRQKSLLVSAAMLLMGVSSAFAARTAPTVTGLSWSEALGQNVYLYNEGMETFLTGSNYWGTRAAAFNNGSTSGSNNILESDVAAGILNGDITIKGYAWLLEETDATEFTYSIANKTTSGYLTADGLDGIWVDGGTSRPYSGWLVELVGDGSNGVKLYYNNETWNADGIQYLGFATIGGVVNTSTFFMHPDSVNTYADQKTKWLLVSADEYNSVLDQLIAYHAQKGLAAYIGQVEAEYPGIDLATAKAAADNDETTLAQMQTIYKEDIADAIAAYISSNLENASLDNPIDITAAFDNVAEIAGSSIDNWTRIFTGSGSIGTFHLNTWSTEGAADGTNMLTPFIEDWVGKGSTLSDQYFYHDTLKVAPGAYKITANIREYNESGAEDISGASLFGNINSSNLSAQTGTYLTYNSMLGYWKDDFEAYAVVGEDSALIFGVLIKDANFNWIAAKDFHVYSLGSSFEALDKARQGELRVPVLGEDDYVTQSIAETYNAYVSSYQTSTTASDIMAAASNISTYYNSVVAANIDAWNAFAAAVEESKKALGNSDIVLDESDEDMLAWSDYVDMFASEDLGNKVLTTEELIDTTQWINEMRALFIQNGLVPGTEFVGNLTNLDFSNGSTGWKGSPTVNNSCGEKYGSGSFDVYQEVENAPVGVYEITMQGFYRQYRDDDDAVTAWYNVFTQEGDYKDPRPDTLGYVYMNDNKTAMNCVYDFQTPVGELYTSGYSTDPLGMYVYPNTMASAAEAFAADAYRVSAFGLVAKKGDVLRIGVKGTLGPSSTNNHWVIFDNFKLIYQGYKVEVILPEFEKAVAALNAAGAMGSDVKTKVNELKSTAEAVDKTDGKAMFEVLADIYAINNTVETSVALFAELNSALESLAQATPASDAVDATKSEAETLYNTITADKANYTDAQATEAIEAIEAMITKLAIPDVTEASDDNGIPMTAVIKTPSFTNESGDASSDGWTIVDNVAATLNYSGIEFYDKDFDMYQDISGLPAGTYRLSVQAFSRDGNTTADAEAYKAGTEGLGKLYAKAGDVYYATSMQHCASIENNFTEDPAFGTQTTWTTTPAAEGEEGVTYYCPNNMQSVQGYFEADKYINELYFKLGEGETMRVGVSCTGHISGQWIMMDNFTLTYYGTNSAKETATDIENNVAAAKVVKVEMIDATGLPVRGKVQGVTLIRTTLSNGKVIVSKVFNK